MENTISLILIEPSDSNSLYKDAYQSYKEIYNFSMARGKGTLNPRFLGGNPIQLEPDNIGSLFSLINQPSPTLEYREYFVSTKANGLRFMMLIGNKGINGTRNIYFVDSRLNFWYITQTGLASGKKDTTGGMIPPIPIELNVDKCLIDGEILFWGQVKTIVINKQIKEYIIARHNRENPLIAFLAFDILYGPINPEYTDEGFKLGNSGSMVGPKAVNRWPTTRRRHVLEEMFLNKHSPLYEFIHYRSEVGLNRIRYIQEGKYNSTINEGSRYHFTILVNPFIKMSELFTLFAENNSSTDIYDKMRTHFATALSHQYYTFNVFNDTKVPLTFPKQPHKNSEMLGKGLSTDGLIFTPAFEDYLVGSWTFCGNRQYKWKPRDELTIDFEVGPVFYHSNNMYYYIALVKKGRLVNLEYSNTPDNSILKTLIKSNTELSEGSIMECIFEGLEQNYMIFSTIQQRYDKTDPNSFLTAISVLNNLNPRNELNFLTTATTPYPNVLDLVNFIHSTNPNTLTLEQKENVLNTFGKEKLIKCWVRSHPIYIFGNTADIVEGLITATQSNTNLYELELRIDFKNPNYNYANCLISKFLGSEYTPVPIVKIYDSRKNSTLRSVYAMIGDDTELATLIHDETLNKNVIREVSISETLYNYDFKVILSEEIKRPDTELEYNSEFAGNVEYQNRYSITSLSNFWRVDIIEYGNSTSLKQAKSMWEQKPKTRVEIEYAPASFSQDLLQWNNPVFLDTALKSLDFPGLRVEGSINDYTTIPPGIETHHTLIEKFKNFKQIINTQNSHEILKDLSTVLIKIFTVLDLNVGNNYGEESLKIGPKEGIRTRKEEKLEFVEEKEPMGNESVFERLRKFHNYIKAELIGKVAANLPKPIKLLDVSVGKGGDLMKWEDADIDEVYAIDIDQDSIEEAKRRYTELVNKGKIKESRRYLFDTFNILDLTIGENLFDIVSCQFTLHYFFESEEVTTMFVSNVSKLLKSGGYFIGTTMLGQKVKKLANSNKFPEKVQITELGPTSYTMKLLDTTRIYDRDLPEYYVRFGQFKDLCQKYNLEIREETPFMDLYEGYKRNPYTKKGKDWLRDYEVAVSELNIEFIFQKVV